MNHLIINAFILGLIGGVIPGPVITATFTEILQSGMLKSFRIILWAMLIETIVAVVSLLVFSSLNISESFFHGLSLAGAAILIWISISIWKIRNIDTNDKFHFSFGKVSAMILANGVLWTFWVSVCVPKAIFLSKLITFGDYLFLMLVETGWLISTTLVAFVFSRFRKWLSNPKLVPLMFKFFALIFMYFAADMVYRSVIFFLN